MVEGVAGPIVRGEFRYEKSPRGVVMNNMRAKRRGEHVVQSFADGVSGWLIWGVSPSLAYRLVREDILHHGSDQGLGCAPQVVATGSLVFPGPCGPSLVRIAFDNWGLLSRCLFDERRVESELSAWGAWCMGVCRSCGLTLPVSGMAPIVPGYIDSGSGLEFAPWPLER